MIDQDPEYQRLVALFLQAAEDKHFDLANTYAGQALKRGDELLAQQGSGMRFAPLNDALETILHAERPK